MKTRLNGRTSRNMMSAKRSSTSNAPGKEFGKLEKTAKKNEAMPAKNVIVEEAVEKELPNEEQPKEGMNGNGTENNVCKTEENGEKNENGTNATDEEKIVEENIQSVDSNDKNNTEHDGAIKTNGNQENGSEDSCKIIEIVDDDDDKEIVCEKSVEIMEEPMLVLSEDDEKLSLHDAFDVDSNIDNKTDAPSPDNKTSSQSKKVFESPLDKKITTEKATTSNGDDSIIIDESDDTNTDTESLTPIEQKVSSTDVDQNIIQDASLIANYSGSTRDLSIDASNTNASNFSDSSNLTIESPSYTRSLRSISGRRSLRPLREISFKNAKRLGDTSSYRKDDTQTSTNVTINTELNMTIGSRKNKSLKRERSKTPVDEDNKKAKIETTKEYLTKLVPSPLAAFKRRFYPSNLSSSTPIKQADSSRETVEVTENQLQIYNGGNEAKKNWCVIM